MKPIKLSPYEQAIENKAELVKPYPKNHPIYQMAQKAAEKTIKSKSISIRVQPETLDAIKKKAKEAGLPYQTFINSILYQLASGKITLKV